jgi:type VII secretion protein EccE
MTVRITLALLFIVPAVMAYPWPSTTDRWVLGIAVAAVIILFAGGRGAFFTTVLARRLAVWRRNRAGGRRRSTSSTRTTALLRVDPESAEQDLPLAVIAGYLDRYGIRADSVRITSRAAGPARARWIGLTLDAADNLAALQARSPDIPLRETAEVAARRLADHLREIGCSAQIAEMNEVPALPVGKETWRGVRTESGYVAAYRVAVDDRLDETLSAVRSHESSEIWAALEFSGTATKPTVTAGCAIRTDERPGSAPLPGLTAQRGWQRPALEALHPLSVQRLG